MGHGRWTELLTGATIPLTKDTGGAVTGLQSDLQRAGLTDRPVTTEDEHAALGRSTLATQATA